MAKPKKKERFQSTSPPVVGLPIGAARRLAKRRSDATLDMRLVESDEKALTVVKQVPPPGDELPASRVIKVDVATRPWIQFLPGIYQDADEENADFLQRFLLITQHLTSSVEERLEFVHELFMPELSHERYLPWLASWMAMSLLEGWDEEKRREIIRRTPELYRLRGTARGLKLALRLFADVKAEIDEGDWPYPGMVISKTATIGLDSVLTAPVFTSQCFTVRLPDKKEKVTREKLRTVHALVESEKPAHSHYAVVFEKTEPTYPEVPFLHVGKAASIGVDSRIGGHQDIPELVDEDLQKLKVGSRA
jgi:phage tail-like protein